MSGPLYESIYRLVRQVPPGKVITYGQVARVVGGCSARMVGLPWLRCRKV
jgi:methylated-DNA-protein-cysteine methyltransferase-like protein